MEVISGAEEARLAYRAAVSSLRRTGDRLLVFDSGGGSSQFTFGSPDAIVEQFSIDVGAVRLTERFGLRGAVPRDTVDAALAAIEAELVRLAGRPRPDMVIAIGGTSTNLAAVSRALAAYDPDVVHGTVIDLAEVDRQIEVYRLRSAEERREILGLQPARADVILAGACIVRTILAISGQDALTVSDRGLRHGVAAERFPPTTGAQPAPPRTVVVAGSGWRQRPLTRQATGPTGGSPGEQLGLLRLELGIGQDPLVPQLPQLLELLDQVVGPRRRPAPVAERRTPALVCCGTAAAPAPPSAPAWRRDTRLDTAVAVPATTAVRAIPPMSPMSVLPLRSSSARLERFESRDHVVGRDPSAGDDLGTGLPHRA